MSIAGFASFFAAVFALNLAFGVWGGYIQGFVEKRRASVRQAVTGKGDGTNEAADAAILRTYLNQERANTDFIAKIIQGWLIVARVVAAVVLVLLSLNGFAYPGGLEIPWFATLIISIVSPVPLWTYVHVWWVMLRWRKSVLNEHKVLSDFVNELGKHEERRKEK